jgi:superfamily I DNA/RNA helicase
MSLELSFSKKRVSLNNEQYKAVIRPLDVNQRIIASAGSGKTTTLTARIAYLIENYSLRWTSL